MPASTPPRSFAELLYRYWFFGWLFRDASRGSAYERASALRHNRESVRWLPVYLRRWAGLALSFLCAGVAAEPVVPAPLQAVFFVPYALSLTIAAAIAAAWLLLRRGAD